MGSGRKHDPIHPAEPWPTGLAREHPHLMTEDEDLDLAIARVSVGTSES
jgi:hypothetical protein